ncbi:MAG: nitroreductase family protein [Lachnospiraceae bacterium]
MELLELMKQRRSVRAYTSEDISEKNLDQILRAGLLSASGRAIRPWELIVVRDKETLKKMAESRDHGASMLDGANAAIVVIADESKTDVWTEDCSIVMANMHLMANSLGVGSCWIQGRLRKSAGEDSTEEYLRKLLGYPEGYRLEATLSLGMPQIIPEPKEITEELLKKVHWGKY